MQLIKPLLIALVFLLTPALADAQMLYQDDDISIPWPEQIPSIPCNSSRLVNAGIACVQLGNDGNDGAVFVSRHPGYHLNRADRLQKHLDESENALADIPNVRVMQTRIASQRPLIAVMDVLRNDATIVDIAALTTPPMRQSAVIIPIGDQLVQVFIYLPMNAPDAEETYQTLTNTFVTQIKANQQLDTNPPAPKDEAKPAGTLGLLPLSLAIGVGISIIIIAFLALRAHLAAKRKDNST